ncbi:MAG: hypothetical protein JW839_16345 [Candidatus Lokiarchaeota archaeon]|nr:hypothetical protein [Candidatus Lokiarchaeota archaeon]
MSETRKVRITCPSCNKTFDVGLPFTQFNESQLEKGLVTVLLKNECGHKCFVFIDKDFKMRGGHCADFDLDSEGINSSPVQNQYQASELLLKYAAEIIKMDIQEEPFINAIGAQNKIDAMENALIRGDIKKAGSLIDSLRKFASEIDEKEFANKLLKKVQSINKLIIEKPNLDWNTFVLDDGEARSEAEYASMHVIHYERLRKVVAELEYEAIEGRLPRAAVEAKRQRLIELMDEA